MADQLLIRHLLLWRRRPVRFANSCCDFCLLRRINFIATKILFVFVDHVSNSSRKMANDDVISVHISENKKFLSIFSKSQWSNQRTERRLCKTIITNPCPSNHKYKLKGTCHVSIRSILLRQPTDTNCMTLSWWFHYKSISLHYITLESLMCQKQQLATVLLSFISS